MGQLRKRGNVWWMRYYRNGERIEESARTPDFEVARDMMNSREGDVADGRPVSPKAARLRFDDAAADLVTEYTINGRRTLKHLQRRIKLHLAPWFAGRRMVDIDTPDVRTYTKERLRREVDDTTGRVVKVGAAPAEVNRELAALKRMFSLAVKDGRLHAKPYIPMLQEHNVRRGFFERAQLDAVKGHLPAALRSVVEFAYLTGWRIKAEILPLEWRHVDWEGRVVRLDPGTTKNGEGRSFPFTAAIETVLRARHDEHARLADVGRLVPYVFHRNGKRIADLRDAWVAACRAAGVPGRLMHDFRRSAVRNLERDGVSRSAAMAMVGHKTESIYRRYAIVDAGALRDAAAKIDQAAGVSPKQKFRMAKVTAKGTIAGTIRKTASA
jgi:integrase